MKKYDVICTSTAMDTYSVHVYYHNILGKFLFVQTFVKMSSVASEETFVVLIFAKKQCIVWYQPCCFSSFQFAGCM